MRAMQLDQPGTALKLVEIDIPTPGSQQLLVKVRTCGVCRTDLHVLDGELSQTIYPIIPGHQIVGNVVGLGSKVKGFSPGQRVGIPWLGFSCGSCEYCRAGKENLCAEALYTGCQINGGFAEYCVADHRYCFHLPDSYQDTQVAPLLCAGLIGYRAYGMIGDVSHIGFMGFGASAHILTQLAVCQDKSIYAFTRKGDNKAQEFALQLGAVWAGSSDDAPPRDLDAVIIFAPDGSLVPKALKAVRRGGKVVCAGIHMSEIPSFSYDLLWGERSVCSVANLTRQDGVRFLKVVSDLPINTEVHSYPLEQVNQALLDLREGNFTGAAVIHVNAQN